MVDSNVIANLGTGERHWRTALANGTGKRYWRLVLEIGTGDWHWRLALAIWRERTLMHDFVLIRKEQWFQFAMNNTDDVCSMYFGAFGACGACVDFLSRLNPIEYQHY